MVSPTPCVVWGWHQASHAARDGATKLLLSHIDMKHATKHTFSGMDSSGVEFFSSGHRDHAEVTFRDTETGDSVVIEGLRTAYLQGAIRNYVRTLGYRDESKSSTEFLEALYGELAKALKKEEA